MRIGEFEIDHGRAFLIAEIGGNHEGDFDRAKRMVREAARSGADAVKFQIFKAERILFSSSQRPAYSGLTHQKQFERFKKMELSRRQYMKLKSEADRHKVIFLASVFDPESADEMDDLLPAYKVASGDLTYYSMLKYLKKKKKPILLSTGASTFQEIKDAVGQIGKHDLAILHCVCSYPAPHEEMNLRSIPFLRSRFRIPVGLSDHSLGMTCAVAAVALGACIIEKHFTLDPGIPYGDHKLSLTPEEFREMAASIRVVEKALGVEGRPLLGCEKKARGLVRRSLFAVRDLPKDCVLSQNDFLTLRPLEGIPAEREYDLVGKKLKRSVAALSPFQLADVK